MRYDPPDWTSDQHARRVDPHTSRRAAGSVQSSARAIADQIRREIETRGPGTFSELATRTGIGEQQVWKRLSDLKNWGLIEPSGEERPGPSGRSQTVWRVAARKGAA